MNRIVFFWIKTAIAVILLGLMLYIVRPASIWSALRSARYETVAIALALMPLNILLQEIKWRYLVKLVYPKAGFSDTLGSLLGGMTFGIVTPGRLGEYGRGLFIRHGKPLNLVGLIVIDKFYNLGCTVAFGLPALMTLPWATELISGKLFVSMIFLLGSIDLVLLYFALDPKPVRSLIYALQIMFPKGDRIAQLSHGLDRFSAPQARTVLALTLAHYLVFLAQYFALISSFFGVDFITSSRGAAAVLFAKSALPIAIADLGVDQLVSVQFFGQFGASSEAAFNASILLFAMNVLLPALAGLFFIGRLRIGKNKAESWN